MLPVKVHSKIKSSWTSRESFFGFRKAWNFSTEVPVVNRCPAIFGKEQQLDQNLTKILVKLLWRSPFRNEAFWLFGSFVFRNTSGWLLLLQPVNLRNLNFFGAIFKNSSKWLAHQLKLVTSTYWMSFRSFFKYFLDFSWKSIIVLTFPIKDLNNKNFDWYPLDTVCKLNLHKTFRRRQGHLLNVLCLFHLRPVSRG